MLTVEKERWGNDVKRGELMFLLTLVIKGIGENMVQLNRGVGLNIYESTNEQEVYGWIIVSYTLS